MLAKISTITYPHSIGNIDGTTSINADQSSLLTQFKTILYCIRSVSATNDSEQAEAHTVFLLFFNAIIHAAIQKATLTPAQIIHILFPPLTIGFTYSAGCYFLINLSSVSGITSSET